MRSLSGEHPVSVDAAQRLHVLVPGLASNGIGRERVASDAKLANKQVFVSGMSEDIRTMLVGLHAEIDLPDDAFFDNRVEAVKAAREFIMDTHTKDELTTGRVNPSPSPA